MERFRAEQPAPAAARIVLRPKPIGGIDFTVATDPDSEGGFVVHGAKPERWVRQTSFDNDEAVGYLADRLARLGVEKALAAAGALPGAAVTIGDVTFDFEPTGGMADDHYQPTRRGEDVRFDQNNRISADDRLAAKKDRRRRRDGDTDGDFIGDFDGDFDNDVDGALEDGFDQDSSAGLLRVDDEG